MYSVTLSSKNNFVNGFFMRYIVLADIKVKEFSYMRIYGFAHKNARQVNVWLLNWYHRPDLNRHRILLPADFKSAVSAYFTTVAF